MTRAAHGLGSLCSAQESAGFRPAETNVWDAPYPRVAADGRVQVRIEAPDDEWPGTDHEWQTWRRDLKDFAPRLFR